MSNLNLVSHFFKRGTRQANPKARQSAIKPNAFSSPGNLYPPLLDDSFGGGGDATPTKDSKWQQPQGREGNSEQAAPDLAHPKGALTTQEAPVQPGEDTNLVFSKALSKNNWVEKRKILSPTPCPRRRRLRPYRQQHPHATKLKNLHQATGPG